MAKCPRCALSVAPYTRCDRCGLMLGFDGLTVLIDFEDSPCFERARALAQRQPSYSEWAEENGRRYLRVTYSKAEMGEFKRLAAAAAKLSYKRTFLNGMEIHWPVDGDAAALGSPLHGLAPSRPQRATRSHAPAGK
ncbi:MAG: hypothetical protein ACRD2K_01290 [Terriglobales bacterium]